MVDVCTVLFKAELQCGAASNWLVRTHHSTCGNIWTLSYILPIGDSACKWSRCRVSNEAARTCFRVAESKDEGKLIFLSVLLGTGSSSTEPKTSCIASVLFARHVMLEMLYLQYGHLRLRMVLLQNLHPATSTPWQMQPRQPHLCIVAHAFQTT